MTKEELEQREVDALDLSDELKSEVTKYAKLNKVSIKEAAKSNYITFLKDEADKKAKSEEASISSTRKTPAKKDYSDMSPKDFDPSTEEGRKEWGAYKNWLKTQ